jgi:hypothetical protein
MFNTTLVRLRAQDATLTSLKLTRADISEIGGAVESLASALQVNHTLTSLDLSGCLIGDNGAAFLAGALGGHATLTSLILNSNMIGEVGAASLATALTRNNTLTSLALYSNSIGATGAASLARVLQQHNSTLSSLNLRGNAMIGAAGAAFLADALHHNTTLTSLSLAHNRIGDAGAASLSATLRVNSTLTSLDLEVNNIRDTGATALAGALSVNRTLTSLSLANNRIEKVGVLAVARTLRNHPMPTLQSLVWDFRLVRVLAAELPPDELALLNDTELLTHWWRNNRGQAKAAICLGTNRTLAGCTNLSPLAALPTSWLWDPLVMRDIWEYAGVAGVPLVFHERRMAPGADSPVRRRRAPYEPLPTVTGKRSR